MEEPVIHNIPKKVYSFFIGLFFCLIAVILLLNIGPVARALSFPFVYSFGIISYFVFAYIYVIGMGYFFIHKFLKFKITYVFFGIVLILIGLLMLSTQIFATPEAKYLSLNETEESYYFLDYYNNLLNSIDDNKGYFTLNNINIAFGEYSLGGGFIGFSLIACFNQLFSFAFGGLIATIFFMVVGAAIIVVPPIVKTISEKNLAKKKEQKLTREIHVEDDYQINDEIEPSTNETYNDRDSINVQREDEIITSKPDYINPSDYHSEVEGFGNSSYFGGNNNPYGEMGTFVKARFVRDGDVISNNHPQTNPYPNNQPQPMSQTQQVETNNVDQPVNNVTQAKESEREIRHEQMQLDFDAKPQINLELAMTKPEFQDTSSSETHVRPQVQAPQAMPEVKKKPRVKWIAPSSDLLVVHEVGDSLEKNAAVAEERKNLIDATFQEFRVNASVLDYTIGPSVTRFNIKYGTNVSFKSVSNLRDDISIRLGGIPGRFESIIEGQTTSGFELPNAKVTTVSFKEVFEGLSQDFKKHALAVGFGKNIKGQIISADFNEFPHMLVSGTTGSGKSVFVNSIICTLIMRNSPDDLKLVLVDPKQVEMSRYDNMPHLLCPVVTSATECKNLLDKLVEEMNDRYKLFSSYGCTNIKEYNEDAESNHLDRMPFIVAVLDEYADLIDSCKDISLPVVSLAQKARACGIHLLIATQRPSTSVVTGVIKANIPTHVALMCSNVQDSITIIGEGGAEKLLGYGDMLVQTPLVSRVGVVRLQSCFIDRHEMGRIIGYLKDHYETVYDEKFLNLTQKAEEAANAMMASPEFKSSQEGGEEAKYQDIKGWVMGQEFMSISRIQRECGVGFNRAGRFFLRLQSEGVVGTEVEGNKGCKVLLNDKFGDCDDQVVVSDEQSFLK